MEGTMTRSELVPWQPKVLIIGGEDVHARIELMRGLSGTYTLAAAGTARELALPFDRSGFPYFYYPLSRGVGPFSDVYAMVALLRLLGHFRPHIVHAFDTKPGVYGCLAARLARVPVVISTVTGLGSLYGADGFRPQLVRGVYERLQRMASQQSDITIFQNRDDRDEFVARSSGRAGGQGRSDLRLRRVYGTPRPGAVFGRRAAPSARLSGHSHRRSGGHHGFTRHPQQGRGGFRRRRPAGAPLPSGNAFSARRPGRHGQRE